ncbi:ABC transporter ATP-binding protein [Enterobacteriaceae endosymbiont of Neohaemonia nigricornis]|uniref:ABC transporter ATP-binding protein n=1 Tax=Enterobacteriaceae endosymbiont of Neohaemonia nigricornis TaxID=2675792 RepID=UPI0014497495|nr:ABC transporter ATP-binding protein [Enterobacteriaceae endosymbiont of Neohaemonia nigricornis]QJC30438.1 ATP-binding cassette domain-containing protein [Enterobacteriaceae endosymbiont of Neohaemonia nigricornis]
MVGYALEIIDLTKIYINKYPALNQLSLNVNIGDFYALLGPNGAGKTTMIGIISSLIDKTSGIVKVFDFDIIKNNFQAKKTIGLVPQEFNFNPFETVIQILMYQAGYYGVQQKIAYTKIKKYLKMLKLWDKRHVQARKLSGGMKRCLMIVRALIHNPKLLILDEPTAGIDIELRHYLWSFFTKINQENNITIILTTHYLEEAEFLCRNIGIINNGILIENCSIKHLFKKLKSEIFILNFYNINNNKPKIYEYKHKFIDNNTLEIVVMQEQGLNNLFKQFINQNINIISIKNKHNRLETFFMDFTKKINQDIK